MSTDTIFDWLGIVQRDYRVNERTMEFSDGIAVSLESGVVPCDRAGLREVTGYNLVVKVKTTRDQAAAIDQLKRHLYADVDIALGRLISSIDAGCNAREAISKINSIRDELR